MLSGECNCGTVAFRIDASLSDIYICHCSICRKWSGANGIAVLIAKNETFHWVCGEENITYWIKPDADWESRFCRVCGSAVPGQNDDKHMFVPVGLITSGDESFRVAHHIWVESRARWDVIGDDGQQHPAAFRV